jgi:hypothetical protein
MQRPVQVVGVPVAPSARPALLRQDAALDVVAERPPVFVVGLGRPSSPGGAVVAFRCGTPGRDEHERHVLAEVSAAVLEAAAPLASLALHEASGVVRDGAAALAD